MHPVSCFPCQVVTSVHLGDLPEKRGGGFVITTQLRDPPRVKEVCNVSASTQMPSALRT